MLSTRIELDGMSNTRDLGGMTGADGRRIKKGLLYRSGKLIDATASDLEWVREHAGIVVDFRNEWECEEKPDPVIDGVRQVYISAYGERVLGITRDSRSDQQVRENSGLNMDPDAALLYMMNAYRNFILKEHTLDAYRQFIRLTVDNEDRGIIFHCTAGKDRSGFAAILLQEILGVSRQDIYDDYMLSNTYIIGEVNAMIERGEAVHPGCARALEYYYIAFPEFLNAMYDTAAEHYGSFEGYIRNGIKISDADIRALREKYLE